MFFNILLLFLPLCLSDGLWVPLTYYFRINDNVKGCPEVQTFNNNNNYGPCNNTKGVIYGNKRSKYWTAIYNAKSHCGKELIAVYIDPLTRIQNSRTFQVMDECPGCKSGGIDVSLEAIIELTKSKEAGCAINRLPPKISWTFN